MINGPQISGARQDIRSNPVPALAAAQDPAELLQLWDVPADALIIIPVRNMVLFPGLIVPIAIGRESSICAAQEADRSERHVGFILRCNPDADVPATDDLYLVGTIGKILRYVTTPDGSHHVVCQ